RLACFSPSPQQPLRLAQFRRPDPLGEPPQTAAGSARVLRSALAPRQPDQAPPRPHLKGPRPGPGAASTPCRGPEGAPTTRPSAGVGDGGASGNEGRPL